MVVSSPFTVLLILLYIIRPSRATKIPAGRAPGG